MHIISGLYKNRKLKSPKGDSTRPTTSKLRESLFNICQNTIEHSRFLDVFAGSGAMGLEALSRGAKTATFIDLSKEAIFCIKDNLRLLEAEKQGFTFLGDVFVILKLLQKQNKQFDIIYMDPPYGDGQFSTKLLQTIDESNLLSKEGFLFIEDSKNAIIPETGWQKLILKNKRDMGKSQLLQFCFNNN